METTTENDGDDTLYGHVYVIKLNHSGHMEFHCKVCQKEMSNEKCVLDHSLSDAHQKKLNKVPVAGMEGIFQAQTYSYPPDTLQYKLLHNIIPVNAFRRTSCKKKKKICPFKCCPTPRSHKDFRWWRNILEAPEMNHTTGATCV
ncbi:uncharacterized protein LOC135202788 [Macrobrachium nipponense]|uniref:uncharacterized protein LOC135202788 n=1 Tax=Macrobrachium nipponense TaxID=159736 RepID=UPI0030C81729